MTSDEQLIQEVLEAIDAGSPRDHLLHDQEHSEAFADILRTIDMLEGAGAQILPHKDLLKKIIGGAPSTPSPTATPSSEPIKGREITNPTSRATMRTLWKVTVPVLVAVILIAGGLYVWNMEEKGNEYAEGTAPAPVAETAPSPAPQVASGGGAVTPVAATGNVDDAVSAISADSNAEAQLMQQELNDSSSDSLNGDMQAMGGFDSSYGNY